MTLPLTQASIATFTQTLNAMSAWLDKAEAHCTAKKVDGAVLAATRLALDMLPLSRQVLIACDFAKNTPARLAGIEPPKFDDNEKTLPELKARIEKTLAYVQTVPASAVDAGATREINFPMGPQNKGTMKGADYLAHYALPNFFFHSSMTYAILRHCGVELGKRDFMGNVPGLAIQGA